ncbi:tumor necrosis factor receptor superfamily member 14-like [Fundulus heteroclitus]|uniref:tumor necrosis factor receptor superfamily member 14-like n=1 Tax=Fundulus heteroclitus TaxID=8078 RepID=UPI00165ABC06|nr:tumor necrosis factor receptor superfamily member 14-like [Fundulus heteroclitus]XP_035998135.1 tumor necrosis factor receptor superfamily member 14-like [Fundulus heteroclitus]
MILRGKAWTATSILLMLLMRGFRVHSISCQPTEYKIGNECCPMCPAGNRVETDCTGSRTRSCLLCTAGTYMDSPNGLKRCNPCSTCDSGVGLKEKRGCTLSTDTVCEPMEGFFCRDPKPGGCGVAQKHRSCEPGQFISKMGTASTDTDCSDCISGTFSDGTMLSCQPHTQCEKENLQLIKAGTTSADAECGEKSSNITGIVIGVLVVFLVAAAIVFVLWKCHIITIPGTKQPKSQREGADGAESGVALTLPVEENQH